MVLVGMVDMLFLLPYIVNKYSQTDTYDTDDF